MTSERSFLHLVAGLAVAFLLAATSGPAAAANTDFQQIITRQITAFEADDAAGAYAFAAPVIRQKFPDPNLFMQMVKSGYAAVYRPRSFTFGAVTRELGGRPTQRVRIVDEKGQLWTALYAFERQPDGSWLISAVVLIREQGGEV